MCLLAACIPGRGGASPTPTAAAAPTVAQAQAATAAPAATATPAGDVYTVKSGDTLSSIAAENGSTVDEIVKTNNLSDPDKLQVGQKLVMPAGSSTAAKPEASSGASASASASGSPAPSAASKPPPP